MKILVIGSSGNIGRKLVPYLRKVGHEVLRADIAQEYASDFIKCDINSPQELMDAAYHFKPEIVYHLAAFVSRVTSEKAPCLCVSTNVGGTQNVVQICKFINAKLINFSTSEIYGNIGGLLSEDRKVEPNNMYGLTKWLAEKIVEYEVSKGLRAVSIRPFMMYDAEETIGVHRSAMVRFAEALTKKIPVIVHKGSKRSWMHVNDAVVALEKCIHVEGYHAINIGHPKVYTMMKIAEIMCKELGLDPEKYIKTEELPERITLEKNPDLARQTTLLGFAPRVSVEEGIKQLLERMKNV
jgi:nucleoside-diphosphate-sugar epimerase